MILRPRALPVKKYPETTRLYRLLPIGGPLGSLLVRWRSAASPAALHKPGSG
jgi:hypothetical protein